MKLRMATLDQVDTVRFALVRSALSTVGELLGTRSAEVMA